MVPDLAYVTGRNVALAPFDKVVDLLSELLPIRGAQSAGAVRNRTMRIGEAIVQPAEPVVVEFDRRLRAEPASAGRASR